MTGRPLSCILLADVEHFALAILEHKERVVRFGRELVAHLREALAPALCRMYLDMPLATLDRNGIMILRAGISPK